MHDFENGKYSKYNDKAISLLHRLHDVSDLTIVSLTQVTMMLNEECNEQYNPLYTYIKYLNSHLIKTAQIVPEIKQIAQQVGANTGDINAWVKVKQSKNRSTSIFIKGRSIDLQDNIAKCVTAFEDIVKNRKSIKAEFNVREQPKEISMKATLSDMHVGMNPDKGEKSMYNYTYNGDVFRRMINTKFIPAIERKWQLIGQPFLENIVLCDLGDAADGLKGQTTRGGHQLPQNMTDVEVFKTLVDTKIDLVETMLINKVARKVTFQSICNDNHSGVFAQLVNEAVKTYFDRVHGGGAVRIDNLHAFMTPRIYGVHCFVITHGKDESEMKHGLPFHLTPDVVSFINNYIRHYKLEQYRVHIEKGDLHKLGFEKEATFDYRNFMSFAPPSQWIQHQKFYRGGYAGFSIQVIPKHDNEITHTDYFLDYDKPHTKEPIHFSL